MVASGSMCQRAAFLRSNTHRHALQAALKSTFSPFPFSHERWKTVAPQERKVCAVGHKGNILRLDLLKTTISSDTIRVFAKPKQSRAMFKGAAVASRLDGLY